MKEEYKVLVGVRPSGRLHLGHYASVIKPARKYKANVLVARLHAPDGNWRHTEAELKRYLPSDKIIIQELSPILFFRLLEATPTGLLKHMPQYKEKDKNALMFTYPVLMAHDLVGYDYVVVGEDQRPHIEFAADILPKIGVLCPTALYEGGKIMDLRHPENKMSKSVPSSCLFLDDEDYEKKIRKAVTDEAGRKNLENIYFLLAQPELSTSNSLVKTLDNQSLKTLIIDLYRKIFVDGK